MTTQVALCLVALLSVGVAVGQSQDETRRARSERMERLFRIEMRAGPGAAVEKPIKFPPQHVMVRVTALIIAVAIYVATHWG